MPVITINKIAQKEIEYVISDGFSLAEQLMMNPIIKASNIDTSDAIPFIIRRVIQMGAIPVFNYEFTYETRVLLNNPILGVDANNERLKEPDINMTELYQIIPSNTAINVLYLYLPRDKIDNKILTQTKKQLRAPIIISDQIFAKEPVIPFSYAALTEVSLKAYDEYIKSSINTLIEYIYYVNPVSKDALSNAVSYKPMKAIAMHKKLIDFFNENKIIIPHCEYESVPFAILTMYNRFEDYIHKVLGSDYRRDRIAETKFIDSRITKDYILASKYIYAYKTLFGFNEWLKIKPRNYFLMSIIQAIPKNRLDQVETEIARQDKFWKDLASNTCSHVAAVKSYYKAVTSEETRIAYNDIKSYIDKSADVNAYLMCKLCHFRLICPHKFVQMDYIINDRTFDYVKQALYQFADEGKDYLVTCRICNEGLYHQQFIDLLGDHNPITSAEDKKALWHDATFMLHTYVKFTESVYDKTSLIRIMVNSCYETIMGLLNTMPSGNIVTKWRTIYADMIFAAYLLNLDKLSKGHIKFNYTSYLSSVPIMNKKKTEKMIEQYRLQLSDINVDHMIKQTLPKEFILSDPIYLFAADVMKTDIFKLIGKTTYELLEEIKVEPLKVEGSADGGAKVLKIARKHVKTESHNVAHKEEAVLPDKNYIPDKRNFQYLSDNSKLGKLRNYQLVLIFNKLIKYGKLMTWKSPGDTDGPNTIVKTDKGILETISKIDKLNNALVNYRLQYAKSCLPVSETFNKPTKRPKVKLTEIFAPDGSKIVWDKLVYGKELVPRKEGSINKYGPFTDKYSSKWNLYYSEAKKMDDSSIRQVLDGLASIDVILGFYFNRCPEGHIHEMSNNKCKKCSLYQNMSKEDKSAFAIKYKKSYEKDKIDFENRTTNSIQMRTSNSIPTNNTRNEAVPELEAELTHEVLRLMSNKFNIPINAFKYLALSEGIIYDNLMNGSEVPVYPKTPMHAYVAKLNTYILEYFAYKSRNGMASPKLITYNYIYNKKKIKPANMPDSYVEDLMNWMRAIMYIDAVEYHHVDNKKAIEIIQQIMYKDGLMCKNTASYVAVITDTLFDDELKAENLLEVKGEPDARDDD